jgi:hypothetical protein
VVPSSTLSWHAEPASSKGGSRNFHIAVLLSLSSITSLLKSCDNNNKGNMHLMLFSLLAFAALLLPTQALYFYMDGPTQKCFFEELPKDTLVVGESIPLL